MSKYDKPCPPVEGIVVIAHDLHCKTPEAEKAILEYLSADYDIKDGKNDKDNPHDSYFAALKKDVCTSYAKCDLCGHLNSRAGCRCHGFTCKNCGEVIYKEYVHRAPVKIYFLNDQRMPYLHFMVHSYDMKKEMLYVYAKPQKSPRGNDFMSMPIEKVPEYLDARKGDYEEIVINGKKCLGFYHPERGNREEKRDKIKVSVMEAGHAPYIKTPNDSPLGHSYDHKEEDKRCRFHEVQVYKGQEVKELPVRESYSIYPTYKHSPARHDCDLSRKIIHAAGQVSRCDYYYQDGSKAFYDVPLGWMALYVEHFTDLNVHKFKKFIKRAPLDGPGFIVALALWVQKQTGVEQYVENRPNLMNALIGLHKVAHGERLSNREAEAMKISLQDRDTRGEVMDFFCFVSKRQEIYNPLTDADV